MKFLERFTLVIYSYIILLLSILVGLLVFNWIEIETIVEMIQSVIVGATTSKIILGVCVVFILLSLKCIFFDSSAKEKIKGTQGILLKNENGELLISKESIDNMVRKAVEGTENVKDFESKISFDFDNQISITLNLIVDENVILKDLATNLQNKVKSEIKKIADLEVKEVNLKVTNLQESKKKKEPVREIEKQDIEKE